MKLPAIQWYPGDWLRDPGVQSLSYEDQGIWFAMLMRMWEGEERGKLTLNGHAMPVEALARLLGLDNQKVNQTLTTLLTYGVTSVEPTTGIIYSRRMVRDEELRKTRQQCGKLGGNPLLVNQAANQKPTTKVKQKPTPSSSSSSSDNPPTPLFDLETAFDEIWEAYPAKGRTKQPMSMQYYVEAVATLPDDQQASMHARILAPLLPSGKWASSAQWAKGFVQGLPVYLNQMQWLESPEPAVKESYTLDLREPEDDTPIVRGELPVFSDEEFAADIARMHSK